MIGNRLADALSRMYQVQNDAVEAVGSGGSSLELERIRVQYLGKKSALTQVTQVMAELDQDQRKELGGALNRAKGAIEEALLARTETVRQHELDRRLKAEQVDVTLPGTAYPHGSTHPLLQTVRDILDILREMGYDIYEGPEVEWEEYNFDMLNTPQHHPARDVQDTFWITDKLVLRTQTSPAQIRYMLSHRPPIRAAMPGYCYRNEAEDASHGDRFYQIEGLVVDTDISLADLKGTLAAISHRYFGPDRRLRFRPHYFPFTEPSAELDIECIVCKGVGCRSCGNEGWLELGGSGVVHPNVLRACGYDPDDVSGFAFGIGPARYAMMKHGVPDLRLFREGDLRFSRQFD